MEFKIDKTAVYGLGKATIASGNPMRTLMADNTSIASDIDMKRMAKLGTTKPGEGHDQALTGIVVQFDLYAPLYMWKEIQRYHFLDFISSQSTMHRLAKFNIAEQCTSDTDPEVIRRVQELLDNYNYIKDNNSDIHGFVDPAELIKMEKDAWRKVVASLPCGFVLGATMTTNYRQLKTIYYQRRNHKLKEWHEFCEWCLSLPHFAEYCVSDDQ